MTEIRIRVNPDASGDEPHIQIRLGGAPFDGDTEVNGETVGIDLGPPRAGMKISTSQTIGMMLEALGVK